jgi:UDPglucose--hexose-1-phosphate uridylyltransferase
MPEYRQNPLTREWVILNSERQARPSEFLDQPPRRDEGPCPFCVGNEEQTPAELAMYAASGSPGWAVRVVPNKYPAVTASPCVKDQQTCKDDCLFRTTPALGEHEVIIESPRHVTSLTEHTPAESELLFLAYRDRLAAHKAAGKARYVQIFKNVGPLAGASIEHSHSQVLALDELPQNVEREVAVASSYQRRHGQGLLGAILEAELKAGSRVIGQSPQFIGFCPHASRFPYEVCVAPRISGRPFDELQAGELGELALFVREIIGRIEGALGTVAYNYYLRPAPFDSPPGCQYDWHIEIFPRRVKVAGCEWSTGVFINTVSPEAAAAALRGPEDLRGAASGLQKLAKRSRNCR